MTVDYSYRKRAYRVASSILEAFISYQARFKIITQRAQTRFEQRDWHGMQADAAERLDLYKTVVDRIVADIGHLLGNRVNDTLIWGKTKGVYANFVAGHEVWQLAETFFNSVTRRIFATVGVNPQIEFVDTCSRTQPLQVSQPPYRSYSKPPSVAVLIETILADYQFQEVYEDRPRDIQLVSKKVEDHLRGIDGLRHVERCEMLAPVLYRGKGAYLVGRIYSGEHLIPLVLALLHAPGGIVVDAALLNEDEVSVLFSFTRSYFHVDVQKPSELVSFLKSIMPRKRIAELYIAIGCHKHGKSELYCDFLQHLARSDDTFEIAEGEKGLVMVVFTMPSYDLAFKLIKDRFAPSKKTTRQSVMEKYRLVFKHDRAGRLVDAQEFEYLQFDLNRFSDDLLSKLQQLASETVVVERGHVIIKHVYVERRVTPLNIYLRKAEGSKAQNAVMDYGNAIKDLAATNIFPGDMLLKNFGVTRHGRVVFYDYDELCLLTSCNFRIIPEPRSQEEELSDEPWFPIGENDIFPEEFQNFLGLGGDLKQVFVDHHADLFDVQFWQEIQARLRSGEVVDIFPYDQSNRLVNT